ncbi:MAG: glycosyltransferase family 9 protein [Selenomonadaceae bacterium]|nr:glycosyltransferase family 9 protein [Selenomonadaceae bacterium]
MWQSDAALILDGHYRSALMAFIAFVHKRIGPGRDFINIHTSGQELNLFEVQRYMDVLKHVGIEDEDLTLMRPLPNPEEKHHITELIDDLRKRANKIVTISPYSLSTLKDWEPEKYTRLIDRLHENDCEAILIGGTSDMSKSKKDFNNAVDLVGKINLRESSEVIAQADLHVCGCTSMLHVASSVNTPSVAIYGPTSPVQWAPRHNCTVITHNLPCSPCYKKDVHVCDNNRCIKDITVDEVWEAIANRLNLSVD